MVNNELASKWHKLLSGKQIELLMAQDAGMDTASILIDADDIYVLLIRASEAMSFKVIDSAGGIIASSSAIVARLRDGNSSFARMAYENEPNALPNRAETLAFDENHYLQKCYEECNVMKYAALANVGIRFSEFSLDEVYISASACEIAEGNSNRINALLDDQLASFPISPGLKKHIKQQYVNNTDDQDRHETSQAREFCQQYGAILLTGDPGSGKTCFVKSEILSYARRAIVAEVDSVEVKDEWHSGHVPVLVQLSQVAAEADLDSAGLLGIASRLLERRGFCFPADKMNDLFKQGRLALFFDGLDEIVSVEKRALVVQHINKMVTECLLSGNRIVVTSRPVAINVVNLLPSLRRLELQGLTDVEIRKLAAKILSLNIVETKDGPIIDEGEMRISDSTIIKQLLQDCAEKPGVARFATNPLLLTLLVVIYANSGAPSAKRHRIYEEAVKTLASVRGRQAGHEPVSLQDLRERLGAVALSVYRKESGLLPTRSEVVEIIRNVMTRQIGVPVTKAEADKFVQRVAESTGLISIGGNDGKGDDAAIVTFMHHSFMEYFAAVGLNRELDKADVKSLILQPRWIEILTLLAGIIGENADIAPVLAKFIGNGDDYGDVDARFLIFALDCALECEVPSEAALRLLSISWSKCLEKGTARLDPWVRSEIGSRLSQLIMACGIGSFEAGLLSALRNSDPCACAAAISLASYACVGVVAAPEIVKAINESCSSSETVIQIAICEAAGRVDWFRTCLTRQVIARCLRKGVDSKSAAFEAIIEIPGLATNHWEEIVAGLEESDVKLRRLASKAAVQAGLDGDLVALSESKKNQIANALQYMCESGLSYEYPSSKIRQTTIDILMNSGYLRDRLIGIQLLPAIDGGGDVVYRELMNVLDKSVDHHELTAGLRALRSSPEARVLVTIPDLRKIIKLSEEGTSDVRSAGIQLLGCFGADVVSIRSLIGRDWSLLATSEFENVCHALGRAQVLQEEVTLVIEKEIVKRTREGVKKNESYIREICALLDAARNLGKNLNVEVGGVIRELILDYRQDEKVKQAAVRAYPAVAVPSPLVVEFLAKLFKSSPPGLLSELVQTLAIFAKNCRQSVESVLANVEALSKLQATAIEMHHMLQKREPSADTEYLVTELRNGIYEVSQIIITFEEYLKPHPVRGIA